MPTSCLECVETTTPTPNCPTTTFVVPNGTPCVGTVTALSQPDYTYKCSPMSINKIEYKICSNCPCSFIGIEIDTLPAHGKLYLHNIEIEDEDVLTEQTNGQLIYEKTANYSGEDTFNVIVLTSCGNSTALTITINVQEVDCTVVPSGCTTC